MLRGAFASLTTTATVRMKQDIFLLFTNSFKPFWLSQYTLHRVINFKIISNRNTIRRQSIELQPINSIVDEFIRDKISNKLLVRND